MAARLTQAFRDAFHRHPWLTSALVLTSFLAVAFALRFVIGVVYWSQHQNEPIRPWMTIGYVGRSYNLNPRLIDETAGLPMPEKGRPFTLEEIAEDRGVPVDDIIRTVEETIAKLKARQP